MHVLLVNAHGADITYGGAERYVAELAGGLGQRGHEIAVLSAFPVANNSTVEATATLHNTDWRHSRSRRLRNHAGDLVSTPTARLRDAVESIKPDIIHTSNLPGITTAVWEVARRLEIPVVHTLHDYYLLCPRVTLERPDGRPCTPHPLLCGTRTRRLSRWAGAVRELIAGSEHLLHAHDGMFLASETQVIRLPRTPVAERPLRPASHPPCVVGYLGALERNKGVEILLEAVPQLTRLGVTLRIAGDGRLKDAVEAASGPGLDYAGRVTGDAKLAFLESVDLALVPSLWAEPSGPPYVVLEWLAAGRPVLVSLRGGLAETASIHGVVPIEPSADGLTDGVRRLLDGQTWRTSTGDLRQLEDDSDVERWLDEHEAVYERAIGGA